MDKQLHSIWVCHVHVVHFVCYILVNIFHVVSYYQIDLQWLSVVEDVVGEVTYVQAVSTHIELIQNYYKIPSKLTQTSLIVVNL